MFEARPRARLTARAAILAVFVLLLAVVSIVPIQNYLHQRADISALEHQTRLLEQANTRLESRVALLHDPTYLEQLARACLGMVKPGETGFLAIPKDGGSSPPTRC